MPLLVVGLTHDNAVRDFLDSGVLEELSTRYRLAFVGSAKLTADLSRFGPLLPVYEMPRWRMTVYSIASGLWHMAVKRRFELNRVNTLRLATFGMSARLEAIISLLSVPPIGKLIAHAMRSVLRATAPTMIPEDCRPDAVLAYTSVRSYFADDLVRAARRRGVPLLAVTHNWDNLNTKAFLEPPPHLGVWGEQGFLIARLMHGFAPNHIFVVGAPRFEIYRRGCPSQGDARTRLGIPANRRVLLFCGAGVPFEEVSLLDELEAAISDGRLPSDVFIVYKPHPLRFQRSAERPFVAGNYRHVMAAPEPDAYTRLTHYPLLLASADALISPFSSMVMEGAFFGLPALCVGYNDPGHANHDWNRAAFNLHNYVIRHGEGDWVVLCETRTAFIAKCSELMALIGDPSAADAARAAAGSVWTTGRQHVAERIWSALDSILHGQAHVLVAERVRIAPTADDAIALGKDS